MGKGGVGKTTVAAAVAVELAVRGFSVHLGATDPAAHVAATVAGAIRTLRSVASTQRRRREPTSPRSSRGRAPVSTPRVVPSLKKTCVRRARKRSPSSTRSPSSWRRRGAASSSSTPRQRGARSCSWTRRVHRDVMRGLAQRGASFEDAAHAASIPTTKVLVVTLPETTPVSEAGRLQEDLRRAKIEPYAWVVNASLAASGTRDPLLRERIPARRS